MSEVLDVLRNPSPDVHLGLAPDGGGMMGIVSAAATLALREAGLLPNFNKGIFGISSGAYNGAYALTNEPWLGLSIYYNHLARNGFADFQRFILGQGPMLDMGVVERAVETEIPLDARAVVESFTPLTFAYTDLECCSPVPVSAAKIVPESLTRYLSAGAHMPILSGKTPLLDGRPVADGGIYYYTPIELAAQAGCTHILSLASRNQENEITSIRPEQRILAHWLNRHADGAGEHYIQVVREAIDYLAKLREGEAKVRGATVLRIYPDSEARVARGTKDIGLLLRGMYSGFQSVAEVLGKDHDSLPVVSLSWS